MRAPASAFCASRAATRSFLGVVAKSWIISSATAWRSRWCPASPRRRGCAVAAGIPLTLRGVSQAVTLVTGHGKDGEPDLDWAALAALGQTLAIYMGRSGAGRLARRLIEHGLPPATPAAVIENGTLPEQRVLAGTLGELEALVRDHRVTGPALIVIGEVVRQADAAALPESARAVAV